ncbi:MAG: hypothetical protein R3332_00275 [Pseudohongiellaceae bacterium]|nr:hypothetical protein [Pseudohongiellaceae bacterium]
MSKDKLEERIKEIENAIACQEMSASQVFTQMRQLINQSKTIVEDGQEPVAFRMRKNHKHIIQHLEQRGCFQTHEDYEALYTSPQPKAPESESALIDPCPICKKRENILNHDWCLVCADQFDEIRAEEEKNIQSLQPKAPDGMVMVPSLKIEGMPYVLIKSGMYYAHNDRGYVNRVINAEIYNEKYAKKYASMHEGVRAIPISDAISSYSELDPYIERLLVMSKALLAASKESE